MNVYLWTDNPYPSTKSIDLRWKTLAQIQAEWFDVTSRNWSYILDSNGLRTTQKDANNWVQLYYKLPKLLTASNKIYLKQTWYGNCSGEFWGINVIWVHIWPWDSSSWHEFYRCIKWQYWTGNYYTSSPSVVKSWVLYDESLINSWNGWTRWNVTIEMNIDLSTGGYSFKCSSPLSYTLTWTLTSSQISTILTYQYVIFSLVSYTSWDCRIYTAEFTVE